MKTAPRINSYNFISRKMIQKIISSASEFIKMQVMLTFEAHPLPLP